MNPSSKDNNVLKLANQLTKNMYFVRNYLITANLDITVELVCFSLFTMQQNTYSLIEMTTATS